MVKRNPRQIVRCVNGKWLAQSPSGTQRYASQVMEAVSRTPAASELLLVLPCDAVEPPWAGPIATVRSRFRGILFEQLALPWIARGKHIISMAGPAPLLKRNQTVVMHDAMPFRHPHTFRRSFVAWYWLMYFVLSRTAKRVLTVSTFSQKELAQILRVPESRFGLAPCGSDHLSDHHSVAGVPHPSFEPYSFALIVGNLAPHKNVEAAAQALADAGLPVVIVGVAQQIFRKTKVGNHPNLVFLGRVDDEHLSYLYATAGVLISPSRYEGFGIPIVEAARRGCPSVFALGSAMTEVAGDGGLGFHRDDISECVSLTKMVIGDQAFREQLSVRAELNAKRFTWARTAEEIFSLSGARQGLGPGAECEPLRVLHVTESFAAGTGTAIIEYARAIKKGGAESFLLAQDRDSGLLDEVSDASPFHGAEILQPGLFNLWRALRQTIDQLRPDVVHLHSSMAGAVGRLQPPLPGSPAVVYSPHCFAFERRDIPRGRRWAYRIAEYVLAQRTDAFICVSPHEAQLASTLSSTAPVHEVLNIFEVPHAIPPAMPATAALRLVTVGRVAPQKDPKLFLEILAALRGGEPVGATWVGDGTAELRGDLEEAKVSVTGWLAATQVPSTVASHTIYLHTAGWEASVPIAVLDAMAVGLPVVVKRNDAYRTILPDYWQFDDAPSAIAMIRQLRTPQARCDRIRQQLDLLDQLRFRSPEAVIVDAYRRTILSKDGQLNNRSLFRAEQLSNTAAE